MKSANPFGLAEICNRPGDAQNPGIAARCQSHGICRLCQQLSPRFIERDYTLKHLPIRFAIGAQRRSRVSGSLKSACRPDAIRNGRRPF